MTLDSHFGNSLSLLFNLCGFVACILFHFMCCPTPSPLANYSFHVILSLPTHLAGYCLLSFEAIKIGCIRVMVVFKLVLFVCCGLRFSRLMQQPSIENNTIFATASEVNELPATGKSVLRGGKSMGAQDCDKMLGKKGWDFVIG